MNILVTGGAGFVGSHLMENLLLEEHKVICFDNFDFFYNPIIKWRNIERVVNNKNFCLVSGNITDKLSLEKAFKGRIDAVVHLAAQAGVRPSIQNPELHFNVNVMGTILLLELCVKHGVEKVTFPSSAAVYGQNEKVPFSEDAETDKPLCHYAITKKAGENICYTYHHLYGMDIVCLRPFTIYGPRQLFEMAVPIFVQYIYKDKEIIVFGDGDSLRDYTYVTDVVSAIMKTLSINHGYEIYNIGSGQMVTIFELISLIEERLGKKAKIKHLPAHPGEAKHSCADISKAREKLGYVPQYTIETGLDAFIKWYFEEVKNV